MKTHKNHHFSQILAASLALSSSFGMISPVLAQVAAGTPIRNTATATFSDGTTNPDGTPKTYNATSNEVVITVAEVAGITVTANPPNVTNPNAGAQDYVDFVITNTGNDPTQFFIPGTATLRGTAAAASTVGTLQIVAVNGTNLPTPVNVPTAGQSTATLLATGVTPPTIALGGTITVRVPVTVAPGAKAGDTINVTLGNTTLTAPNTQNQPRTGTDTKDVYTVDNLDGAVTTEIAGAPINGIREAVATSSTITVNARQQAFSTVLKAVSSFTTGANPNDITDDVITYALALRVENPTTPPTGLVASDLYGTAIRVNGANTTPYVLVSDAIPTGMKLGTANPIAPTTPSGWQVVYTTDALTVNALNASWSTTRPGTGITRVGFIYNTTTAPLARNATVGTANTISGFSFTVTPDTGFTGGQIANIAQTFGQSQPGVVAPGTATQIVYDESGDQTSNNGLGGTDPDPTGGSAASGGITTGQANPAADGTDPGTGTDPTAANTNQGQDTGAGAGTKPTGGEDTVYTIAATPLNGPTGQPGAIGPTNTNDDFTNKSIVVPAGLDPKTPLTDVQTTPVLFTNTVQNTSGGSQVISLLPTPPATPGDLLDGTKVTITDGSGNTAIYTYAPATGFTFTSGTGGTSATVPIKLTVAAGATANYTTTVDLPGAPQLQGYPVPVTAFVDVNNDGGISAGEPSNITIDRVYTNYLELKKEARLLEADGTTPVAGTAGTFSTDQTALGAAATPGRIIEYRVTYTNISTSAGSGTNNVILPANNLVITENGSAGNNTWFTLTLDPKYPTPANGTATNTGGGTIAVTTAQNGSVTDIQAYTNTVTTVAPAGTGTLTFQRKIK